MKNHAQLFLFLLFVAGGCDSLEIDYPGTAKCQPDLITDEVIITGIDLGGLDPHRTELDSMTTITISKYYRDVCPRDSVSAENETMILSATEVPVFAGGYIQYEDSVTNLSINWTQSGNFDRYTGSAKAKAPKGYTDNIFSVTFHFSFSTRGIYDTDMAFLKQVLQSVKLTVQYKQVEE